MSTFMANKGNIERKWYVIDAAGKPMGKTAVAAADLLRSKRKVTYTRTPTAATTSSSSTLPRPSSPATRWSRSTIVRTPAGSAV